MERWDIGGWRQWKGERLGDRDSGSVGHRGIGDSGRVGHWGIGTVEGWDIGG